MNQHDRKAWTAKTQRLNQGKTLAVGDLVQVILPARDQGVVTEIQEWSETPLCAENHGSVTILFSQREEHYSYFGWQLNIRKL